MNSHPEQNNRTSAASEDRTNEEEIIVALEESADNATTGEQTVKKLRERLKACEKERQEYLDGWQRARADFVNARREEEEARKKYIAYAKEEILSEIAPVIDNFEHAFANKESWDGVPEGWRKGVLYIYSQFLKIVGNNGLTQTNPLGEVFDPLSHESVESIYTENEEEHGKIVAVVEKGYMLNGKVVRPAKVKVAEYNN